MHRITGSRKSPRARNKPVALLLHGLLDCSATWVMGSPEKSLGFILADEGYDVWMGNIRGNRYARKHKWMTTKEKQYWMFSWHEFGVFDIPAMIDYALSVSKQRKLIFIGHSQGTTSFFVTASLKPEYQNKVEAMVALAPAAFMKHMNHPLFSVLRPFADDILKIADLIGMYEFMPTGKFIHRVAKLICKDDVITQPICETVVVIMGGPGEKLLNQTLISEIVQYDPAGSSTRQFVHYAQLLTSGRFCQYDHGLLGNLKQYGWIKPPDYPLEKIKIPVYLHYSSNDAFVNEKDLYTLYAKLPNRQKFLVLEPSFTHLDFVWSKPVDILLYKKVLSLLSRHRLSTHNLTSPEIL